MQRAISAVSPLTCHAESIFARRRDKPAMSIELKSIAPEIHPVLESRSLSQEQGGMNIPGHFPPGTDVSGDQVR